MIVQTDDLIARGLVAPERAAELRRVAAQFAVALTDDMAALIDPSDPADPIAAQFVPRPAELRALPKSPSARSRSGVWQKTSNIVAWTVRS